jgi:hypothetical protein
LQKLCALAFIQKSLPSGGAGRRPECFPNTVPRSWNMDNVAQQLIDLTRVVTDAAGAAPGKPVHVDVLPGFSTALPTTTTLNGVTLSGSIVGTLAGTLTGTLAGVLNTLVEPIQFSVTFSVRKGVDEMGGGGMMANKGIGQDYIATPDINVNPNTDPLNAAFLLKPPVGEDTDATPPIHYAIDVTISVMVEGLSASKTLTVPVDVPAVQIPALLLLGKHANFAVYDGDDAGSLFVMVRASSPLRELGTVVATLNRVMGLVGTLKSILDFGSIFIDALGEAAKLIGTVPTVYFSVGNAPDLDGDGLSFEDEASSLLLIGVHNGSPVPGGADVPTVSGVTQVTLYNDEGFDKGGIDEEHTTFSVDEQIIAGIPTGVGVKRIANFTSPQLDWATDPGDHMNDDSSSVRWGGMT